MHSCRTASIQHVLQTLGHQKENIQKQRALVSHFIQLPLNQLQFTLESSVKIQDNQLLSLNTGWHWIYFFFYQKYLRTHQLSVIFHKKVVFLCKKQGTWYQFAIFHYDCHFSHAEKKYSSAFSFFLSFPFHRDCEMTYEKNKNGEMPRGR